MDQAEALNNARRFATVAQAVLPFDQAVLFGSYATDSAREHSDVDIGLFVEELSQGRDYLTVLRDLYGLAYDIDVHIEPHLFIRSEDRSGFGSEVEKHGIPLTS